MNKIWMMVMVAVPLMAAGCGSDANSPASVEEQAKAVRGSKPTPEQLAAAMKDYKGLAGAPPAGGAPAGPPGK